MSGALLRLFPLTWRKTILASLAVPAAAEPIQSATDCDRRIDDRVLRHQGTAPIELCPCSATLPCRGLLCENAASCRVQLSCFALMISQWEFSCVAPP